MKEYKNNPRKITPEAMEQLRVNMAELGDLSGIVHDETSDEIIGGNQRSKVIDINRCQIDIKKRFKTPDAQGTVAIGFVIWQGQRLNYRLVRWTEKQRERANITANKLGGTFDLMLLRNFGEQDLLKWGFDEHELFDYGMISKATESGVLAKHVRDTAEDFGLTLKFHKRHKVAIEEYCRKHGKASIVEFIVELIKE